MAIAVVNKKQTGSTATETLTMAAAAAAGNIIVAFVSVTSSSTAPTGKDNVGTEGWVTSATKGQGSSAQNNVWVMVKEALGGEEKLEPQCPGGVIQGISYVELSGCTQNIDVLVHTDNPGSVTTVTSPSATTGETGEVVLAAVGGAASATGTVNAWTGTGPELTRVESVTTRCAGGYAVVAGKVEGKTFTANWTTAKNLGLLVISLKPVVGAKMVPAAAKATTTRSMEATSPRKLSPEEAKSASSTAATAVATEFVSGTATAVTSASATASAPVTLVPNAASATTQRSLEAEAPVTIVPAAASAITSRSAALTSTGQVSGTATAVSSSSMLASAPVTLTPSAASATTSRSATITGSNMSELLPEEAIATTSSTMSAVAPKVLQPQAAVFESSTSAQLLATRYVIPTSGQGGCNAETSRSLVIFALGTTGAEPPTFARFITYTSGASFPDQPGKPSRTTFAVMGSGASSAKIEPTATTAKLSGG